MKNPIENATVMTRVAYIVIAVVCVGLGIAMAAKPELIQSIIRTIAGVAFSAVGAVFAVMGYTEREKSKYGMVKCGFGGCMILLGLAVLFFINPVFVLNLLSMVSGAIIIIKCVFALKAALKVKRFSSGKRAAWMLILTIISLLVGVMLVLMLYPRAGDFGTTTSIGWLLIAEGVVDFVFGIVMPVGKGGIRDVKYN